jgi:tetratricopeptide (TPR) repeat protein
VIDLFFREGEEVSDLTVEERRTVSLAYLRLGQAERAAEILASIGSGMSNDEAYSLALLYGSMGETDKSLEAFREFFNRDGVSPVLGIRLVQLNVGERRLANAESLIVILREAFPENAEITALKGTLRYMNRDTVSAIKYYNEALALDSLNEEALRTLAHIHIMKEKYDEAAYYYRRLSELEEVGIIYLRGLALLLFHLKDYEGSENLLDSLIQGRDPDPEGGDALPMPPGIGKQELFVYRGAIYSQTNRFEKAAADFRAALAIDPRYEDAWKELCYAYMFAKDTVNARAVVDEYVAAFPQSGAAWRFNGYIYNMEQKFDEAIDVLRKALEIDPADYFGWFKLGSILERQKRLDEASDAFRTTLRIRPNDGQAANYLGYIWADAGINLDSAKVLIEIALKEDSLNGAYLDSYAWVFYRMGDYEKALYYMNKAMEQIKNDPDLKNDPIPYEHLGDILFRLKDYRGAEAAYRRSLELKTEDAERINGRLAEIKKLKTKEGP